MKFWKSLRNLIEETLPDWRDKFLSYKDLKKQLKLIYPKEGQSSSSRASKRLRLGDETDTDTASVEVIDFAKVLEKEINKFNAFFLDKQEEYIIRLEVLAERVAIAKAKDSFEELMKVGREIVDFHGEMVLLENYSALNYTGLVKILKKYDKLSGALIRSPFIQNVLQEPFFRTDVLKKLVHECESMLDRLFPMNEQSTPSVSSANVEEGSENKERSLKVPQELAEIENMENTYLKQTVSALRVLKEIRRGSSTVSMFSLPPLPTNELEEVWKIPPVLEQAARSS